MSGFYMLKQGNINKNREVIGEILLRTDHLFRDKGFYREYHTHFFEECLRDNIRYVELRTGFAEFTNRENPEEIKNSILFLRPGFSMKDYFYHSDSLNSPDPAAPDAEFLELILSARDDAAGNKPRRLKVKAILTASRNKTMHNMKGTCKKVDAAIAMKNGIALVKHETPLVY